MKHLLKLGDLTSQEILSLLDKADILKEERKQGKTQHYLQGKTLGMIFRKSSTRTRVSFETAMYQLGGCGLFLSSNDTQMGRGEPVQDTARVLSRYLDGIMIRTYSQQEVEDLAKYGTIPVINGLTDYAHPCQVLADLMTIREYKGTLEGKKLCFIGDGNNMANSLIIGAIKTGMSISLGCPKEYNPDKDIIEWAKSSGKFEITEDLCKAAAGADAIYTDVWASMGMEQDAEIRKEVFEDYQVNEQLMRCAKHDAIVLHCLPAHRGEEITEQVFEEHANEIFDEAENRLHAQKAVLVELLG